MLCLSNYTYHRWHQFMYNMGGSTGAKGVGTPRQEDHTYQYEVCVPAAMWHGGCGRPLWSSSRGQYLRWNVGVLCRTSSQKWESWNFPRFLLRDGSLTFMKMASLTVLVMLYTALTTKENCPHWYRLTMSIYWRGVLRCSLSLSLQVLPNSPMYSSSQPTWVHLNL